MYMKIPLPSSVKLALAFVVFGTAWILFSDTLLLMFTGQDVHVYNRFQHYKGILFMILAALFIFIVSKKLYADIESSNKHQQDILTRYRFLGMATNDAVWDYNMDTGECYTNRTLQETFGYTEQELQDNYRWWTNNLHPSDKDRVLHAMDSKLNNGGTVWQDEYRFRCKSGIYKTILDRGFIMRDTAGKPYRIIGAMQDVTEQRILQARFLEAQVTHKDELAKSVLQAEEAERKKLGEELHDHINQLLGVVKLYIQHAQVNAAMRDDLLSKSASYIAQTIEEIRKLSRSLLPPALGEQSLLESIYQLIEDIHQAKDIDIMVQHDQFNETNIPENKRLITYRIIQEQLNNVLKHAAASAVLIQLKHCNDNVRLTIHDNGVGFDAANKKPGMGMNNIRNRIEVFSGHMDVESTPGKGCTLSVEF